MSETLDLTRRVTAGGRRGNLYSPPRFRVQAEVYDHVQEEATVDFSTDELGQLFTACGVHPPPGLEAEDLPPEVRDAVEAAVVRSLRARAMVATAADGTLQAAEPIAQVISLLARPSLAASASESLGGHTQTRRYGMAGTIGVELRALDAGLNRLTLFETTDLLARVLAFLGSPKGPRPHASAFRLAGSDLRQALRMAAAGDLTTIRYILRSAQVPRPAAVAFSDALSPETPVAAFEVTYLAPDGVFRGGELNWIDHPAHGLWSFPPIVDGTVTVEVSPTSPEVLVGELRSYFPLGQTPDGQTTAAVG